MALNGSIATSAWRSQAGKDWKVVLEWTATQNIEKNTSTIKWQLKMNTTQGGYVVTSELRVKFAGEQIYYRSYSNHTNAYNGTVLASGEKVITHNNDGTKSFSVSVEAGIYNWAINKSGSGTITLDTIPRASTVTCSTANIGAKPTINIARASSSFTHTLRYKFGSLSGTIVEKTSSVSYKNWTIPTTFYAQIPNAKYGTGTIYCDTYSGSELIGTKSTSFRANVSGSAPTLSPTVEDVDAATLALTGDANRIVRYYSDAQFNFGAAAVNSATLKSYKVVGGAKSSTSASGTFTNVETAVFNFSVTDSRGYTTEKKVEKTLVPYVKLTCDIWQIEANVDGTMKFGIAGNYFNGSFGAVNNELTIQYRYKAGYGEFGDWQSLTYASDDNTYEVTVTLNDMDYKTTYTFEARAVDKLTSIKSKQLPMRCQPVFDWGEDDFNVNVDFNMNGKTVLRHNLEANNTVLSASGGFIYFRPGGTTSTYNEARLNPQGKLEIGDILINGQSLLSILQGLGVDI